LTHLVVNPQAVEDQSKSMRALRVLADDDNAIVSMLLAGIAAAAAR